MLNVKDVDFHSQSACRRTSGAKMERETAETKILQIAPDVDGSAETPRRTDDHQPGLREID
jgi:hypothetical protein